MYGHKHVACEGARTLYTATRLAQIEEQVLVWEQSSLARLSEAITTRGLELRRSQQPEPRSSVRHPSGVERWSMSMLPLTDEGCGLRKNSSSPVHYKLRPNYELWRSAVTASCAGCESPPIPRASRARTSTSHRPAHSAMTYFLLNSKAV